MSGQFDFAADDLAYITDHYIHLDHEQRISGSAGVSYQWAGTRISSDLLIGSGLRADLVLPDNSSVPNGAHLPTYRQVNAGLSHAFDQQGIAGLTARLDVINAFDEKYQIRDGNRRRRRRVLCSRRVRAVFAGVSCVLSTADRP